MAMSKLEIDYSLPYEEAKKKYGRNGYFMSEDQYKQMQAKAGVKAQEASPDGNGMVVNGVDYSQPYEVSKAEHQEKYGLSAPFASEEEYNAAKARIYNQGTSPDVDVPPEGGNGMVVNGIDYSQPFEVSKAKHQEKYGPNAPFASEEEYNAIKARIYNQGTSPDVDDTKAIGATKEELDYMLQNGQISRAAYEKQIADLNTPEVQEEMARGENKADETVWDSTNREVASSVTEVTTPKKDDPPEVGNSKNQYNKAMMSIWDAYRNGEISKETAGYFTIDAIATLAKNLGRSIGNVGAQFSGGTIDNGHDESKWGQRQNALLNEEIGKETESLGGAAGRKAESENIANLEARIRAKYSPRMLDLEIESLENEIKKSGIDITKAENSLALIEHIKKTPDYANSLIKKLLVGFLSQTGVGGAVNTGASALEKLALLKGK